MPTIGQIRGMLLEEALLHLLTVSGYQTVEPQHVAADPTLCNGTAGLEVIGRGGIHQIDAIADYSVAHPFSHPQRLLVEAKCYQSTKIGIEKIRNAVGVLKDVEEYWVSVRGIPPKKRYHYQYAFFSATPYTPAAERYAYAQDIYLIPLANSKFMKPLIDSILNVNHQLFGVPTARNKIELSLKDFRQAIRHDLRESRQRQPRLWLSDSLNTLLDDFPDALPVVEEFFAECLALNKALLAMINRQFPVFLVPNPELDNIEFRPLYQVRIYWDDTSWYLQDAQNEQLLFSFDLPTELFELYAEQGQLSPIRALDLKAEYFREMQAVQIVNGRIQVITFELDTGWLSRVRERIREKS